MNISLPSRRPLVAIGVAVLVSLAVVSTLVLRLSSAGFTASTGNENNAWQTGTVALTDDDAGTAMFNTAVDGQLTGGQSLTRCIAVTYGGSLTSNVNVRMYATATGDLAPYLTVKVEEGTGGRFGDCSTFVAERTLFDGGLPDFATAHSSYASGAGGWTPGQTSMAKTYKVTVTVADDNAAQAKSAAGSFTWEAQSA